ncbi:hypothetical protein [Kitasatospora sp. NPDC094011]|uniref:hypothetical protein n=1 Tax=Kitasatospora sp. NPDC094011 TaxID=3364090 RepID=UPI00381C60DA
MLMAECGASSLSAQKAMALLKQDGYPISRPGKGAFVARPDADEDPGSPDVGNAPVGGMVARVEALEQALAGAVGQIADLRARVEAVELGGAH